MPQLLHGRRLWIRLNRRCSRVTGDKVFVDLDAKARGIRNSNETVYRLRMGNDGLGSAGPIVLKTLEYQCVRNGG